MTQLQARHTRDYLAARYFGLLYPHDEGITVFPKDSKSAPLDMVNLLNPTDHVMHQQFNVQQLYVLPTLYLCVLYLSENKQRLVPLTA